jgi:hypothetical protein
MSGALGIAAMGLDVLSDILLKPKRSIGIIVPDCTMEEVNHDELSITEHPIEYGTPITDHAFKLQREVSCRYGWDNSILPSMSSLIGAVTGGPAPSFSLNKVLDVYNSLLALQSTRQPFALFTGKQHYPSMLIKSLTCTTDARSENALIVQMVFREVIIVKTQSAQVNPVANQAAPQKTAAPATTGPTTAAAPLPTPPIPPGVGTLDGLNSPALPEQDGVS